MCGLETRSALFEAQNCQNSLLNSLLAGNFGQRKVSARLPPPPRSLGCRETGLHSTENPRKSPQFRDFSAQTGPEKMSRRTPQPMCAQTAPSAGKRTLCLCLVHSASTGQTMQRRSGWFVMSACTTIDSLCATWSCVRRAKWKSMPPGKGRRWAGFDAGVRCGKGTFDLGGVQNAATG